MTSKLRDTFGFLRFVLQRWHEDRCPQIAGSLTYTTLLAIVPLFTIVVAVMSSTPFFDDVMSQIKIFLLLNLAPEIAQQIITVYMGEFSRNAARLTSVGVVLVLALTVWMLLIMDRSLNAIWRVRATRPWWLSAIGYVLLVLSGPILLGVSVSITTYLMRLSVGLGGADAMARAVLLRVVPVTMSAIAFFMIYRIIPHRRVPWRHALLGGFVAAALFEAAKELFRVYVHHSPTYSVVWGAFALVPIFLVWIYLSWLVILFGAELTASAAYWRDGLWRRAQRPAVRFREAVAVMQALLESARGMSFAALQERTRLPAHELEETLAQMIDAAVVKQGAREGYTLTRETRDVLATPPAPAPELTPAKRGRARSGKSSR